MAKKNGYLHNGSTLGLSILSAEAGFGIWSSLNPSLFTIAHFAESDTDMKNIREGMLASLGIMGATAAGIYLAFGKEGLAPALSHLAVGVGLTALYGQKIGWNKLLA